MTNPEDQIPDHGHRPLSLTYRLGFVVAVLAFLGIYFWSNVRPKECWTLGDDEIETFVRDGQRVARLRLDRIPPGECVVLRPGK